MKEDLSPLVPLSPAILHILTALAGEERHGYGIMQEVSRQSEGQYKLGPGTLYDNLEKLMKQGMVDDAARRGKDEDPRRGDYRPTSVGRPTRASGNSGRQNGARAGPPPLVT